MRRFVFKSLSLLDYQQLDVASPTIAAEIEGVLDDVMNVILDEFSQEKKLPLVRLSVDATGFPPIPVQLYGSKFVRKIANPSSLLHLRRKRISSFAGTGDKEEDAGESLTGEAQFDMMVAFIVSSVRETGGLQLLNTYLLRETR